MDMWYIFMLPTRGQLDRLSEFTNATCVS